MLRRTFLVVLGDLMADAMISFSTGYWFLDKFIYRIQDLLLPPQQPPPDSERKVVELPTEGETISVETALNSRCNSDYDENTNKFHWGIFWKTKKLSKAQIQEVVTLSRIPRFTDEKLEIRQEGNTLTFIIKNVPSGFLRQSLMVESGMQQQAVGLVCAALGIGTRFSNLGEEGKPISDTEHATINIKVDPMKPSYNGSFWTKSAPTGRYPWLNDNLPSPNRYGQNPLISVLQSVQTENDKGHTANEKSISQLLWAARGRTPHLYKSRPWGMTIPTAQGKQDISGVWVIFNNIIYRYSNWDKKRPTHSLEAFGKMDTYLQNHLMSLFPSYNCYFVIATTETSGIALWEIGYQLLNLLLQSQSFDIAYQAKLLSEPDKNIFHSSPIDGPVAIVAVNRKNEQ